MSTGVIAPRPVSYKAKDFHVAVNKKVSSFDEEGRKQEISYHAFVVRSKGILEALTGRVREYNKTPDLEMTSEKIKEGRALLEQSTHFDVLVSSVSDLAREMFGWLPNYDELSDLKVVSALVVMCKQDAVRLTEEYSTRMEGLRNEYFTKGAIRGIYLANRVEKLEEKIKKAEETLQLPKKI